MAIGLCGFGVQPLIFGDLKPDYVDLISALSGNVVALGRARAPSTCSTRERPALQPCGLPAPPGAN